MKILKFDTVHPLPYLSKLQRDSYDYIKTLDHIQYLDWLHSYSINHSNFYTDNINKLGHLGYEFYINDQVFLEKLGQFILKENGGPLKKLRLKICPKIKLSWQFVVSQYIEYIKPDVLLLREPSGVDYSFISNYKKKCLIVTRINCPLQFTNNFNPSVPDLLVTGLSEYKDFFQLHGIESHIVRDAFESSLINRIDTSVKKYDVTFIGSLCTNYQFNKSCLLESVAEIFDFRWWGPIGEDKVSYPFLMKSHNGITGGLEMYNIYASTKVNINDYPDVAGGHAVNQRIFEVMGSGGFLLTRYAPNLDNEFPPGVFATYTCADDCLNKIEYYLNNEGERNKIAKRGQEFVLSEHNYLKRMNQLISILQNKIDHISQQ